MSEGREQACPLQARMTVKKPGQDASILQRDHNILGFKGFIGGVGRLASQQHYS